MTFKEEKNKKAKDILEDVIVGSPDVAKREVEKMLERGLQVFIETDGARYIVQRMGNVEKVLKQDKKIKEEAVPEDEPLEAEKTKTKGK